MRQHKLETRFAPAERESLRTVGRQSRLFKTSAFYSEILDAIPDCVMVLNDKRQIIFANDSLVRFLAPQTAESFFGQRPGEALQCTYSDELPGGCGTTEHCSTCGALKAILASLRGKRDVRDVRLLRQGEHEPLDVRITAGPLYLDHEVFSVSTLTDVSHEKRRRILERIFFHDVLNIAGGLTGVAELLVEMDPRDFKEYSSILNNLTWELVDQINAQRELAVAESGELMPKKEPTSSLNALRDIVELYKNHAVSRNRVMVIDPSSTDMVFEVDQALLRRVLGNMLKNAIEASQAGQTVRLGCARDGMQIVFWVQNPGVMPRETQLQVFHRSFSTKGEGRGLGTYSIKLLTERYMNGKVSFSSTKREGTVFRISLSAAVN